MKKTVQKLITAFEGQSLKYETYYKLVLATGLRRGEACGLKWCDINWKNGRFTSSAGSGEVEPRGIHYQRPKNSQW